MILQNIELRGKQVRLIYEIYIDNGGSPLNPAPSFYSKQIGFKKQIGVILQSLIINQV